MKSVTTAHRFSLFALFLIACDTTDTTSDPELAESDEDVAFSGELEMVSAADDSLLCTGSVSTWIAPDGSLSGDGDCGDLALEFAGWTDHEGVVTGSVSLAGGTVDESTAPPSLGTLSGALTDADLSLIWSIEIPMPDDPPLDDDIYQLVGDGEAWLTADP